VSWKQVAIALAIVFAAMWLTGEAMKWLAPWKEARSMVRDNPSVAEVPTVVPDQSLTPVSGVRIDLYGLAIQTPWSAIGTVRTATGVAYVPIPEQPVEMVVYEPYTDSFARAMWDDVKASHNPSEKAASSNYGLMAAEMAATPDQVKWWRKPSQNEANSFLLESKSMLLGNLRSIYVVNVNGFHGFQEGNPEVAPYGVRLDLFDSNDLHYQFRIVAKDSLKPILTQPQLNAIVASLKPIRHS
jgi:hypothetical protein